MRFLAACVALLIFNAPPAFADAPSAQRGKKIVEQWCRECHQRPGGAPDPDMAPPHEIIANLPGRDRAWFDAFMAADHFPMTTFRLHDQEKTDVVEWLVSLKVR